MVAGITGAGANSEAAGLVHCVEKRIVSPVGSAVMGQSHKGVGPGITDAVAERHHALRSEEHTSELQSLMRISYAVFCLKKKNQSSHEQNKNKQHTTQRLYYT